MQTCGPRLDASSASFGVRDAQIASAAGLDLVMDRCAKVEHARFAGGLHLAGLNTGVITARR